MKSKFPVGPVALVGLVVVVVVGFSLVRSGQRDDVAQALPQAAVEVQPAGGPGEDVAPGGSQGQPLRAVSPEDPRSVFAPPRDPEQFRMERDRYVAGLEQEHRNQPIDPAWAAQAERSLERITEDSGLKESGITPASYNADCRSSSCRVSATFATHGEAEDWSMMYITSSGETFQQTKSLVLPTPDGGAEARIYGSRRR